MLGINWAWMRVARGARLLDKKRPKWAESVDVETLNIGQAAHCIIGQVFGDYGRILNGFGISIFSASAYGFSFKRDRWFVNDRPAVEAAWKRQIRRRVAA